MKRLLLIPLTCLLATLFFVACGSDEPEIAPTVEYLTLRSTSVAEGQEVYAEDINVITCKFSGVITIKNTANITLNGSKVTARNNTTSKMDIDIPVCLEPGMSYKLVIAEGSLCDANNANKINKEFTLNFTTKKAMEEPEPSDDPNVAIRMARAMGWGWNLGNHFDTGANSDAQGNPIDFEKPKWGYWDGAKPTETLYKNLARMGVKTVRIPVTWGVYQANDGNYTIDAGYMAEVEQNVKWALNAGQYVVLNTHHDEYWQDIISAVKDNKKNATIEDRLTKTWTQIANHFKNYDDHLIFETMNEIHDESWGWKEGYNYTPVYTMMNEWNKVCVDAIRATGGNNASRWIGIPGFCANPSFTVGKVKIPNNDKRIMVAVHCYDPFNFCTEGKVQQWGHKYRGNDSDEKQIRELFDKLYAEYIAKEIPCYMGEYGVVTRSSSSYEKYRQYYLEYFTRCAYLHGIPTMLWDNNNNNPNGEMFYFFDHNDGTCHNESLVKMMIKACTSSDVNYTLQSIYDNAK